MRKVYLWYKYLKGVKYLFQQTHVKKKTALDLNLFYLEDSISGMNGGLMLTCWSGIAPKPKLSMFYALSQNYQYFLKSNVNIMNKLSEKLKKMAL